MVFFGGREWCCVAKEVVRVPHRMRAHFVLSLFMIVVSDQALYTYFHPSYDRWRMRTNYPKFGWSGFGCHNENPCHLLWAPEKERALDPGALHALLPEFVSFFIAETTDYFQKHLPDVRPREFFDAIQRDEKFANFSDGTVVSALKALLKTTCEKTLSLT